MKRAAAIALVLALALSLAACGDGRASDPSALGERLSAAADGLPDMTTVTSGDTEAAGAEFFRFLSDLDYEKVAGYYMSYATAGSPEEIAVIALKHAGDAAEAKASLERHVKNRLGTFRTYSPEDAPMLEDARIVTAGDAAALIICKNALEVEDVFREALR